MPELPEVETLAVQLARALEGRKISEVEIRNDSLLKTPRIELQDEIVGKQIVQVGRRGKYIRMDLSRDLSLWFHLGMTGQLFLEHPPSPPKSHTHFILSFLDSSDRLFYRDIRRFGRIALTSTAGDAFPEGVKRLGREPQEWNLREWVLFFKERRARIKSLLLNQRVVAGLGNIYADESLHRAGIHPLRRASQVSREKLERLHEVIREILDEAIRFGGSSIDDFIHVDGGRGRFQEFHRVYGRVGRECFRCGAVIRTVKVSGRTSSFCPRCQH